jgi:DNA modification methylase
MQLDLIDRAISQWSMQGEVVYDPFSGLGSVPMRAVALGRYGMGSELAAGYFADSVMYCRQAEDKLNAPTLFDLLEAEGVEDLPLELTA